MDAKSGRTRYVRHVCPERDSGNWTGMATKRELIEPNPGDKRFVRRDADGKFAETVGVSASLASDARTRAKKRSSRGTATRAIVDPRKKT